MRRISIRSARMFAVVSCIVAAQSAGAQALGPQRQFLAIEPYYEHTSFDVGSATARDELSAFGGRLWINLDPFHFITNSSISLFLSHAPSQSGRLVSYTTYGLEYNQYLLRRPAGGWIDPFFTIGGGGTAVRSERANVYGKIGSDHSFGSVIAGGGIRIPAPNRFQLRIDAKDLVVFNTPTGAAGVQSTSNNLVFQAGLGITF